VFQLPSTLFFYNCANLLSRYAHFPQGLSCVSDYGGRNSPELGLIIQRRWRTSTNAWMASSIVKNESCLRDAGGEFSNVSVDLRDVIIAVQSRDILHSLAAGCDVYSGHTPVQPQDPKIYSSVDFNTGQGSLNGALGSRIAPELAFSDAQLFYDVSATALFTNAERRMHLQDSPLGRPVDPMGFPELFTYPDLGDLEARQQAQRASEASQQQPISTSVSATPTMTMDLISGDDSSMWPGAFSNSE
jgi:hypothetical protein